MDDRKMNEVKISQETEEGRDFLETFITKALHNAMGKSLDLFRITEISDRAMEQVKRTLKDYYNEMNTFMINTLKEKGYIKSKE